MTENVNEQLVYEAAKRGDISLCLELLELLDRFLSCEDKHTSDRIVLNVGGEKFETSLDTLSNIPWSSLVR